MLIRRFAVLLVLPALMLTGCQTQRAAHVAFADAERAYVDQDYPAAIDSYEYVVSHKPGSIEAKKSRLQLGRCYLATDRPVKAREQLEIALTHDPNSDEVLDLIAEAALQLEDAEALYGMLRRSAQERNTSEAWTRLGRVMLQAGDVDEAEQALLRAARLDRGRSLESQLELARLYREVGDDDAALERLRMALFIDPSNPEVADLIRDYGKIPGPTFALRPLEWK